MDHTSSRAGYWILGFMALTFNLSTVMMLLVTAVIVFLIAFISTRNLALKANRYAKLHGVDYGLRERHY